MEQGYPYVQLVHPQHGAVGCRAGAVGLPGEVREAEWWSLEDSWVTQPRAAAWALLPIPAGAGG